MSVAGTQAVRDLALRLVELLEPERIDLDLFRGARTDEPWPRVFGGQVIGQALMAASRTIEGRLVHSLHAYFMRPGDPALPIIYQVARDRDGKSFSSRRVVAIQHGQPILNLAASFHVAEPGLAFQRTMPDVPPPDALEDADVLARREGDLILPERRALLTSVKPIQFRPVDPAGQLFSATPSSEGQTYWFRVVARLPDDQVLHRVILAYASDMMLLSAALAPHGIHWARDRVQEASLDHALWFHCDVRVDEWLLYTQESPWSGGARGLSRGMIYRRDGTLAASVAQEGLIRLPRPQADQTRGSP